VNFFISSISPSASRCVLILLLDQGGGSFSLESAINPNLPCNNQYIYIHHYSYI